MFVLSAVLALVGGVWKATRRHKFSWTINTSDVSERVVLRFFFVPGDGTVLLYRADHFPVVSFHFSGIVST